MQRLSRSTSGPILLIGLLLLATMVFAACTGEQGPQGPQGERGLAGPQGPQGPAGPPGSAPTQEELEHLVLDVLEGPHVSVESIARGGRLYDKWWKEAGLSAPTSNHPLWALQTTNTRSGPDTWRCKECHGWDYKGAGGAYSSGGHYTGFPGVINAGATLSKAELLDVMQGATDYRHDFSGVLGADDLDDLVNFLSEALINDALYFDYTASGKPPISPNMSNGQTLFGSTCVLCHGSNGKQILIEGELGIGDIARDEPTVEIVHKIRAGQPGTAMASAIVNGWSTQDAVDVLAYVQTLP